MTAQLLAAVVMVGLLAAPGGRVRHEDPATVQDTSDPAEIFGWYLDAARRMTTWQFAEGRRGVVRLDLAHLPPEVSGLVGDMRGLLLKEGSILEATDEWLREAARLIAAGRTAEAAPILRRLERYVRQGNVLFEDIASNVRNLGARTNVESLPPDAPQRLAYEELQRAAARAKALLAAYQAAVRTPASSIAAARLLPYVTRIELGDPGAAHPGRALAVSGRVVEDAPARSQGRRLRLWLDGRIVREVPAGSFRVEIRLPADARTGAHELVADVPAQGRYLAAEARRTFRVVQVTPDVHLDAPSYAFAPGSARIAGTVSSSLGAISADVAIEVGETAGRSATTEGGTFDARLRLPGALNLVGPETLVVDVRPREPWHAPVRLRVRVFIINLVNLGLLMLLIPIMWIAYSGRRRRAGKSGAEVEVRRPALPSPAPEPVGKVAAAARGSLVETVLAMYLRVLQLIQRMLGVRMEPSMTLREFLQGTRGRLRGDGFARLTHLTEAALYSRRTVEPADVDRAGMLANEVEGELHAAR